jgi:pyruvate/2-oxoglutarate dehydrogenase complex dihydrolipoamide acyltransferase (E2) component
MKTRSSVALVLVALLCLPAAAAAHTGAATVSCTGAQFSYARFQAGSNTVNYRITVDNTTLVEGTFVLNEAGGTQGHLTVPFTLYDTHEVKAFSWWGPTGTVNGETRPESSGPLADTVVQCAPAPPPVAVPAPAVAPAAAPAPAPATQPESTSTIHVQGERVSSPTVRMYAQKACAAVHARITVTGTSMRQVRFSVRGRRPRTVKVAPGARKVSALVALRRHGPAVQKVTTRITFRNGAPDRTLVAPVRRCSQAAVAPQFTG